MQARAADNRRAWTLALAALAVELLVVGAWASIRGVNADEGFYLAAGRNVAAGEGVYRDFFFPQMPYLPWLEGVVFRLIDPSLMVGRAISVAAAALSAGLIAGVAWRRRRRSGDAALAVLLYVASALLIASFSVVKTAATSNLCLLSAFVFLAERGERRAWAFAAGIALGCAVGLRGPVAPVGAVLALMAWWRGRASLAAFAAGAMVASLPWLWVAARSPDQFWFGNFGFHALRREISGMATIVAQKAAILAKWFFLPQHALIWLLAAWGLRRDPQWSLWPAAIAAVLAITYAAATPTYLEYMSQFFPFLLLAALPALPALLERRALGAAAVAVYLVGIYPLMERPAVGSSMAIERDLWSLQTVREVSRTIRENSTVQDRVLSWWEGYPVLSARPGFRGVGFWESNAARKLDADSARRYRLMRRDEVREAVGRRDPAVVVVPDGTWDKLRGEIDGGYVLLRRVATVSIYARKAG